MICQSDFIELYEDGTIVVKRDILVADGGEIVVMDFPGSDNDIVLRTSVAEGDVFNIKRDSTKYGRDADLSFDEWLDYLSDNYYGGYF